MFAIVTISGKQYSVAKGDIIVVDKLEAEAGDTMTFDHVLLTSDAEKTVVGTPLVAKSVVTAKVIAQEKGEKIDVRRYKQKVRHRRHIGFRAHQTKLEVMSIS